MAGLVCSVPFSVGLVSGASKTIVQVKAPANQRLRILGWDIGFTSTTSTDGPVTIIGSVQSRSGTGGVSATPVKKKQGLAETPQATAQTGPTSGAWSTTDPIQAGDLTQYQDTTAAAGDLPYSCPLGAEFEVAGGGYFALVVSNAATGGNTAKGTLYYEE